MSLTYSQEVYVKQQLKPEWLQKGFLKAIKKYYRNQDIKDNACDNNDKDVYIYLSALFHNTEKRGSNIVVLTNETDLEDDTEYGNPNKLFEALFTNRAFYRWKKNSFDLKIDQNMMHIKDQRFLTFQNDTELILRTSKGRGIAFSLHLDTNDALTVEGKIMKKKELITIDEANKYFFVTTLLGNGKEKPLEIRLRNGKQYRLASAVVATSKQNNETAGGHYYAIWVDKFNDNKALKLDSLPKDNNFITSINDIQKELKLAVILIYSQLECIDNNMYENTEQILRQTKSLCFLNSGLNALKYISEFHNTIKDSSNLPVHTFSTKQINKILEFSKGKNKIEPNFKKDLDSHLKGNNQYLSQKVIEGYINLIKHGRGSLNPIKKNILIFDLDFVDTNNRKVILDSHYKILKDYFHLLKLKTSSAFNDAVNIPLEDKFDGGVNTSSYMFENLDKNIFKTRTKRRTLIQNNIYNFFYDSIELRLDILKSILIPVGDSRGKDHFWLYHIFFKKENKQQTIGYIHCYNKNLNYGSGKLYEDDHKEYLKTIKKWLQQKLPTITVWINEQHLDIQEDGFACGVYVCQFIREIVKNNGMSNDRLLERLKKKVRRRKN